MLQEDSSSNVMKRRLKRPRTTSPWELDRKRRSRWLYGVDVNNLKWIDDIPECPVYRPSRKDFENPFAYLQKIAPKACNYGICKIVSPLSDFTPAGVVVKKELKNFKFEPSVQPLKYGTWLTKEDKISYFERGRRYKYEEFEKMANEVFAKKYSSFACLPCNLLEREFWREMAWGEDGTVEYGVNVEGSAFSNDDPLDELGQSKWNLKNLPRLQESTLRHLQKNIPGITEPMLYIGMMFSTFAWHVEDHYLYSINYLHMGAPKTWYGVPGSQARNFEKVAFDRVYSENVLPSYETDGAAQVLAEKTTMLPPSLFLKNSVPVYRAVQMPGEFVITFPRSYHAGFSHGFNCAEAVNFAVGDWLPYGSIASKRYSFFEKSPLIPFEELLCKEALLLSHQMTSSETSTSSSQRFDSFSHHSIMVSCITHMAYYSAARRKLLSRRLFFEPRRNTLGTVCCGFCGRDRCLAFLMCHGCQNHPLCIFHEVDSVNCGRCGKERSLFLSDDMPAMEAAADYFVQKEGLLSSYLNETAQLQEETLELYEHEREDGEGEVGEASTSVQPEE